MAIAPAAVETEYLFYYIRIWFPPASVSGKAEAAAGLADETSGDSISGRAGTTCPNNGTSVAT